MQDGKVLSVSGFLGTTPPKKMSNLLDLRYNMNKRLLIKETEHLSKKWWQEHVEKAEAILITLEKLLKDYLQENPRDTEIWIRLAMLEFTPPWEDPERIFDYMNKILAYDPNNIYACLILSHIYYIFRGGGPKEVLEKLQQLKSNDNEINSMLELAKALWYKFEMTNPKAYEQHLLKSIEYCNNHVSNYRKLGVFYIEQGHKEKGEELLKKSDENLHTYSPEEKDECRDITDVKAFLDEYYKGYSI